MVDAREEGGRREEVMMMLLMLYESGGVRWSRVGMAVWSREGGREEGTAFCPSNPHTSTLENDASAHHQLTPLTPPSNHSPPLPSPPPLSASLLLPSSLLPHQKIARPSLLLLMLRLLPPSLPPSTPAWTP